MKRLLWLGLLLAAAPGARAQDRVEVLEGKLEALGRELERLKLGEASGEPELVGRRGLGPAASKVYGASKGLSIGGYGEILYEDFAAKKDDGTAGGKKPQLDALRAVLYFGYKWSDDLHFNSELEIEHGNEVFAEFAYVDWKLAEPVGLRAGLLLLPVGIVNELHEPSTFHGAKRTDVESRIIPTTWRENGAGLFGQAGPVSWRTYVVNSSSGPAFSSSGLRDGRQKGVKAAAQDLSWVGRVDVEAAPGLTAGGSLYVGKQGQGESDAQGEIGALTRLWEAHALYRRGGLELRGLLAAAHVDDAARLNAKLGRKAAETMLGWYAEAAYDVLSGRAGGRSLTPFYRYERVDTQNAMPAGTARDASKDETIHTFGLGFKPHPSVVFKGDWQARSNQAGTGLDQLNLAVAWLF